MIRDSWLSVLLLLRFLRCHIVHITGTVSQCLFDSGHAYFTFIMHIFFSPHSNPFRCLFTVPTVGCKKMCFSNNFHLCLPSWLDHTSVYFQFARQLEVPMVKHNSLWPMGCSTSNVVDNICLSPPLPACRWPPPRRSWVTWPSSWCRTLWQGQRWRRGLMSSPSPSQWWSSCRVTLASHTEASLSPSGPR